MAVAPTLPNLAPTDMRWVRWVTEQVQAHESTTERLQTNLASAQQQHAIASSSTAAAHEAIGNLITPSVPQGPPQQPTAPLLTTDHGTVTIKWDGQVHANGTAATGTGSVQTPYAGFSHVNVQKSIAATGPFSTIGSQISISGSVVDANVVVGQTYWYQLVTTDTLGAISSASDSASILVRGVDLGSLDTDVTAAIAAAQSAASAGIAAAAAGQDAANAAAAAASSAAAQAANALQNANGAVTAANGKNKIIYSTATPAGNVTDNSSGTWTIDIAVDPENDGVWSAPGFTDNGDGTWYFADTGTSEGTGGSPGTYISGDLWLQVDSTGTIIGQWQFDGTQWVTQTLSGVLVGTGVSAANITTGYLAADRIAANSISASQMIAGTITAASGILGDAVITTAKIANLAVNSAQIADLAVNNAKINDLDGNKIQAGTVVAGKLSAGSVTTNNIVAGAIDTNRLAAGAITADKLQLGATNAFGTSVDRVAQDIKNTAYWQHLPAGYSFEDGVSLAAGIYIPAGGMAGKRQSLTVDYVPAPVSNRLSLNVVYDVASLYVTCYDANKNVITELPTPPVGPVTLAGGTAYYRVFVANFQTNNAPTNITSAHVFEIIGGNSSIGQSAQLSPMGLQLFDVNGSLAVDLTTNSAQYLTVYDATAAEPTVVASIDQAGNAAFTEVSSDYGFDISGVQLADVTDTDSLVNASPNGSAWRSDTALFDRLARGVIYDVTWQSLNEYNVAAGYPSVRIAQDSFVLEDGRQYMIHLESGGLQMVNPGNANMYLELQVSLTPITDISTGVNISRGVITSNSSGSFVTQSPVFTASAAATSIDNQQRIMPANMPIYWQLDVSGSSAANAWKLNEFGYSRGLTIIDVGANDIGRPNNGADSLPDVSNFVSMASGGTAPAGSGSTGTTASSKTVTFTARSSRTWNSGGSNIVTGSGQYTNGNAMYYGHGASDMGSWFGSFTDSSGNTLNSRVGGKTVTGAVLTVKNTYTYMNSGASVQFGTAAATNAPSSIGTPASNVFTTSFSKGASKSVSLGSGIRTGLSNGTVRSFVIGVSGSVDNYAYFNGAAQSSPPTLKVTYH